MSNVALQRQPLKYVNPQHVVHKKLNVVLPPQVPNPWNVLCKRLARAMIQSPRHTRHHIAPRALQSADLTLMIIIHHPVEETCAIFLMPLVVKRPKRRKF
uniref:Uncharacterized protein n=1 Tax=Opuntia streptacantha TaxID=393608 RepID=A0A7C9EYR9_OPUST